MLRKTRLGLLPSLRLPNYRRVDEDGEASNWPMCVLCNKPIDSQEIVEVSTENCTATVLARHHALEQTAVIDLGTREAAANAINGEGDDIVRGVRNFPWFKPTDVVAQ